MTCIYSALSFAENTDIILIASCNSSIDFEYKVPSFLTPKIILPFLSVSTLRNSSLSLTISFNRSHLSEFPGISTDVAICPGLTR